MKIVTLASELERLLQSPGLPPGVVDAANEWLRVDQLFTTWIHTCMKGHWSDEAQIAFLDEEGRYDTPASTALERYFSTPIAECEAELILRLAQMNQMRLSYMEPDSK